VKRTPTFEQREKGLLPFSFRSSSSFADRSDKDKWLVVPDMDDRSDEAYQEVIERIARGGRIRGHAL